MSNKQISAYDLGDASANAFASNRKNDQRVEISLMLWDIVTCASCNRSMSLLDATYNEKFAPIHKNCGDVTSG